MKKEIDYETLYELYCVKEYSQRDVANILGISQTTVRRLLSKHEIDARTSYQGQHTQNTIEKRKKFAKKYREMYTKKITKICKHCGKTFEVTGYNKNKAYCSKECISDHARENRVKQFCKKCGKEIILGNRVYKRVYCDECWKEVRKHRDLNRVAVKCSYCGKELFIIKSVFESQKRHYCNIECMSNDYKTIFSGENSPTWKGGKSHHYVGGFYQKRKEARKRDMYTCQLCGITEEELGIELSVHHIKNYRKFDNKEEANELSNLISLCEKCHRFVHSKRNINKLFIKE